MCNIYDRVKFDGSNYEKAVKNKKIQNITKLLKATSIGIITEN